MTARLTLSFLLAACTLWPTVGFAQWRTLPDGMPQPPVQNAGGVVAGPAGPPVQLAGAYAPQSGVDSYGDGSGFSAPVYQTHAMPWEREGTSPLKRFLTEVMPNSYFRVEYLSYNLDDIGDQAIGSATALNPTAQVRNSRAIEFQSVRFFDSPSVPNSPFGSQTLLIPRTEAIDFNKVSGLRATWGIPLSFGRIEISGFALEDARSEVLDPSFGPIRGTFALPADTFLATSFVLAEEIPVPQNGYPNGTTTGGTVLAVGQPIGVGGQGLVNNIPANSIIPASAIPFDPGVPPLVGVAAPNVFDQTTQMTVPLPSGQFYTLFQAGNPPQQVTFDVNRTFLEANAIQNGGTLLPLYIRNRISNRPDPGTNFTSLNIDIPNVVDPSRIPLNPNPLSQPPIPPGFETRFPGGDAIIIVPAGANLAPGLNRLLADVVSPGGANLPAGTVLRTIETGFPVIPLLSNGTVSNAFLVYDGGYGAKYKSNVWGTEAKLILDIGPNHNGFKLNPLIGVRYMSLDENFRQVGVSTVSLLNLDNVNTLAVVPEPARASIIDSDVENSLYGAQVGFSAEYNHKWFSLGVDPRISLGVNNYSAQVTTQNLRSIFDGTRTTEDDGIEFAPVFDVNMYGQIHVTPNFSLHAGYNFTYLFSVTRPADNILYNDNGAFAPPGVVVDRETRDMHIQGLTFGGEFRFRDIKFR